MKRITPDRLSLTSIYLEAYFGQSVFAIATGFPWRSGDNNFLITNNHVVSGLNPLTKQPIDENGSVPDRLLVWMLDSSGLSSWSSIEVPLYDDQGRPRWLQHPTLGPQVDVAALPMTIGSDHRFFPLNEVDFGSFRVKISQDVFIIGFPKGITGSGRFPIWKRGSIASEPDIDIDGAPKLLIDSATREGMSGSPVIAQYTGYYQNDPGKMSPEDWFGSDRVFLGVYSGRILAEDEIEAQLGIVWKPKVIDEIIAGGTRPA